MKTTWILLLAALLFMGAAGGLSRVVLARRQALIPPGQTDMRNVSPLVNFTTVALGGFRGILADLLWVRISALQDEGRYFEITQLADWITKLEPTFVEVWSYHAWNMAYNIGFLFDDPEDRWRWVENGLRMLRDEGMRMNPGNSRLCWEVGWLFLNKIGGHADPAAGFYQSRLFTEVDQDLPGGRLPAERPDALLMDRYRMEGPVMARLEKAYGPLDWRLPESHAAYWAWAGLEKNGGRPDLFLERLRYQALIRTCLTGRAVFIPARNVFMRLPRLDLLDPVLRLMTDVQGRYPDDEGIRAARHFLVRHAIALYYAYGVDTTARNLLDTFRLEVAGVPSELGAFIAQAASEGQLAVPAYLTQVEGFYFEAERNRSAGRETLARRQEDFADLSYAAFSNLLQKAREPVPPVAPVRQSGRDAAKLTGSESRGNAP